MSASANVVAAIRTAVATVVSSVLVWAAAKGFDINTEAVNEAITLAIVGVVAAGYNWLVNLLQAKWGKKWGYLLLIPKLPTYSEGDR